MLKMSVIGNVGQSPRINETRNGDPFASFSIAATLYKGAGKKETQWIDVTVFDTKKTEIIQNWVKKGTKLYLEGEPGVRQFKRRDGTEAVSLTLTIGKFGGELHMLGGGQAEEPAEENHVGQAEEQFDDDEVPF